MKAIDKRHILKTLSWRLIGSVDTFLISWFISGNILTGINISLIESVIKMILYFFHERLWYRSQVNDSKKRHLIKTFSWRIVAILSTLIIVFLVTGSIANGLKIGSIETVSKMILYFAHEKIWYKVNYGLKERTAQ